MNNRQRFNAILHYQPVDRCPIVDFSFWDETVVIWREQGLPADLTIDTISPYLGMDFTLRGLMRTTVLR